MTHKESFLEALEKRILLFDGAMGTEIQKLNPKPEDFPDSKDGFNDGLSMSKPVDGRVLPQRHHAEDGHRVVSGPRRPRSRKRLRPGRRLYG